MNEVDLGILENFVELLVSFCDPKSIANQIEIRFVASAYCINVGVWMALVDRDEFSSETEADHRDIDFLLSHGTGGFVEGLE